MHEYVQQHRDRYKQHDPKATARMRDWRATHPDRTREAWRAAAQLRRARLASVLATLTAAEWEAILEAAGYACIYCGSRERPSMDHLMPIARGGQHTAENVAPACLPCNLSKGTKTAHEFLAEAA